MPPYNRECSLEVAFIPAPSLSLFLAPCFPPPSVTLSRSLSVPCYFLLIQEADEADTKEFSPFVSALQLMVGLSQASD